MITKKEKKSYYQECQKVAPWEVVRKSPDEAEPV